MISMTIREAKGNFFDREKVKRAIDANTRRILSKFGAFVRQRAKTSIRDHPGISPPGKPPHSHVGLLRKFIFFAYDAQRRSVVIGPTLLRDDSEAPRLLEFGGETVRREGGKAKRLYYRARPFMRPAFEAELAQLPPLWKNSIR